MLARASQNFALERADRVVTYTEDYARNTQPLADRIEKVSWVLPPVPDPPRTGRSAAEVRARYGIRGRPVILFLGRFAEEKGLPVLLTAFAKVRRRLPEAVLLLAGAREVAGETVWERVAPLVADPASGVLAPGIVPPAEIADLFAVSDVLALPSINATESFGMVQVEAMLSGVPVVASDLPGVRQPARLTGMGEIARIGDADDLARRLLEVLESPETVPAGRGPDPGDLPAGADSRFLRGALPLGRGNASMTPADRAEEILRAHLREMPLHRVLMRTIEARILAEVAVPAAHPGHRLRRRTLRLGPLSAGRGRRPRSGSRRPLGGGASRRLPPARLGRLGRDAVPDGLLRVGRLQLRVRAHPRHRCDGRRDRPRAAAGRDVRVHGRRRALQRIPDERARLAPPGPRAGTPRLPRLVQPQVRALPLRLAAGLEGAIRARRASRSAAGATTSRPRPRACSIGATTSACRISRRAS